MRQRALFAALLILGACGATVAERRVDQQASAAPASPAAPATKEVTSQFCIRALDAAEESFTNLAESIRGQQAQVDALLRGDMNAYFLGKERYAQAYAKVRPASASQADTTACASLATPVAGLATVEITPPSCLRSFEYFARAFEYLVESISAMQAQVDALLRGDVNAYLHAKGAYAEAFAKIRGVDAPLRADHTDCRSKAKS